MRLLRPTVFAILLLAFGHAGFAQKIDLSVPPPPPEAPIPLSEAPPPPPPVPVFDPFHAAKSIEIGTFYMKRGNLDAAIDRFEEAAAYQPNLARPWELLGEVYEKKRDPAKAVESYQKYLHIYPEAPDGEKVRKRIAALNQELASKSAKK
jgi:tetratricopeptide (TPR) repeat protein